MNKKTIEKYCTGCGLCKSFLNTETKSVNGFDTCNIKNKQEIDFCNKVCPANGKHINNKDCDNNELIWGKYNHVYRGYSNDDEIRYKAASGGITTQMAVYMLDKKYVDAVIQVGEDKNNPFKTAVYCNDTRDKVINCSASRYIESHPLDNILDFLKENKKYLFIGRPCDVVTLKNFIEVYPEYKEKIYATMTFFCAGMPSKDASKKLCEKVGIASDTVTSIRYRGNGWPGKATVKSNGNKIGQMEYIDSWNNILGRDIRYMCKFCIDGIGESADIASGDLWYLDKTKKPIFDETDGVNVVFTRSELGERLIQEAIKSGYISVEDYSKDINDLQYVQVNHKIRRETIYPKLKALKLFGKPVPRYNKVIMKQYNKNVSFKKNLRTFLGTIKRILKKRV